MTKDDESHGAVTREGDVHHGGPGAPSLAQPGRDEGCRQGTLSRRRISQGGLFGDTVEGFAQQFSAVQQQTEAIQHILPRRDAPSTAAPGVRPQSARRRGCLPASSRAAPPQAKSTHRPVRRASRRRAAPPASQPGPKSSRKSMKRPWRGQPGDVGVCSFSGDGENSAAPSPGGGPGGESSVSFCFCSAAGPRASGTHLLKERAISFSSGFSGPWDDSVRRPASSLSPTTHFASSQESTVRGRHSSPRTSGQSRSGPREFGEDASERIRAQGSHHALPRSGGEPTSTALGGGRSSLSVAVSCKSIAHIRDSHPECQKLRTALCLPRRAAEREGCLQTEVGPLDSGGRHLGVPVARRAVPPGGEGPLHQECCLLPCVASLADICRAAGWATPNTFARFYNLCVEPVSSRVLGK